MYNFIKFLLEWADVSAGLDSTGKGKDVTHTRNNVGDVYKLCKDNLWSCQELQNQQTPESRDFIVIVAICEWKKRDAARHFVQLSQKE